MTSNDPGDAIPNGAVVVAVDGSETSDRAVEWAAKFASNEDRPLVIAHAFNPIGTPQAAGFHHIDGGVMYAQLFEQLREGGEALIAAAKEKVAKSHPSTAVTGVVKRADARDLLLHLAEQASLVVMGSRGRGPFRSLLLGSVTAAVAGRAECPVVVIPPNNEQDAEPSSGTPS